MKIIEIHACSDNSPVVAMCLVTVLPESTLTENARRFRVAKPNDANGQSRVGSYTSKWPHS
jgi:hypothetical protein